MRQAALLLTAVITAGALLHSQSQVIDRGIRVASGAAALTPGATDAAALSQLRGWDQRITDMTRSGEMLRIAAVDDPIVPGRVQERFSQRHRGLRVFGGEMTRQLNRFGQAESVFGALYPDIAIDVAPALSPDDARARLERAGGGTLNNRSEFELIVLPTPDGQYRLTYMARVSSAADGWIRRIFVDAATGATVLSYNDTWTQSAAVGTGNGVLGDKKKIMTSQQSGKYLAVDLMRPPDPRSYGSFPKGSMLTFDLKNNINYALTILDTASPVVADIATDDDNVWTDPGLVDAHTYAGYTYDFYSKRFSRKGLDNNNLQIWTFVNPVRPQDYTIYFNKYSELFLNAAYLGGGNIYYGVGLPSGVTLGGQQWFPFSGALDVVAHELTHGVTDYTSKLIYSGESGALNESFSDMMGIAVEFYFQPVGGGVGQSDWLIGEDIARPGGLRSAAAPNVFGDPDHYSIRYTGTDDNGGVHVNSSIVNHMYYLSIMGGTNRISKQTVSGVGFDNRAQIENVMYRAFTVLMPANATFATARAATIQAARDLYGANSSVERSLTQAWSAVGVS